MFNIFHMTAKLRLLLLVKHNYSKDENTFHLILMGIVICFLLQLQYQVVARRSVEHGTRALTALG